MPFKFSANLWMFYPEHPMLERIRRAARAGFQDIEFLFPLDVGVEAVRALLDQTGQKLILFNCPPGLVGEGEWGLLALPSRREAWRRGLVDSLEAARRLNCPRLNVMFGNQVPGLSSRAQLDCARQNLDWALPQAVQAGVTLLVEPLNTVDRPDYFLVSTAQALALIHEVDHPNFKLQYDLYHSQMQGEPLADTIRAAFPDLSHFQIADAPTRGQPGTGVIDFPTVFSTLETLGYDGFIGLEYQPVGETDESFGWMAKYRA